MRKWFHMGAFLLALVLATLGASTGLTAALLFPVHESGGKTPADYDVAYQTLTFQTPTGAVLKGWFLSNPAAHGRTAVGLHGISANKAIFLDRAMPLYRLGFNVLMLDLRRHGDSTGDMTTYGYLESRDVVAAIDQLVRRPDVDPRGVVVMGWSMGGATALQTLPYSKVRAVISDSAFSDLAAIMAFRGSQWHVPSWPFQTLCDWEVSLVAPFQVTDVCPLRCLAASRKPVLLIHGGRDSSVPFSQGLQLSRAGDPAESFWAVPDAGHCLAEPLHPTEYQQHLAAFLQQLN
ncbi:MAG TPA: alpha/beta fold hydrolase [Candidatus Xenobia bacterium]